MDKQAYETLLREKTLYIASHWTGSEYWDYPHHGQMVSFDWIPQSGSVKLIEINTNQGTTAIMRYAMDFSEIKAFVTSSGYSKMVYQEDENNEDLSPPNLANSLQRFRDALSGSFQESGIQFSHEFIPDIDRPTYSNDSGSIFVFRQGHSFTEPIDKLAMDKDDFRTFMSSSVIGGNDLMPRINTEIPADFSNKSGVPDVVVKDPTQDRGAGIDLVDWTSDRNQIFDNSTYVEEYIEPEIEGNRYRVCRVVCLVSSGSVRYLTKNAMQQTNYRINPTSGSLTFGSESTTVYDSINTRIWLPGHFRAGSEVSMSNGSVKNIEDIVAGDVVKTVNLSGYPKWTDQFSSSNAKSTWPSIIDAKSVFTCSISDISESTSSVNSIVGALSGGYAIINNDIKLNNEVQIMVHSESICRYKHVTQLQVGDKFVTRGATTQSITDISLVEDYSVAYSLDIENNGDENPRYFVGGSSAVLTCDGYW